MNCTRQKVLKGEITSGSNYWNYFTISNSLRIEDQYEATYYAKEQIEIIKRIRQQLIETSTKKYP